jgi:quercetin dioxygenase-like cupin family protein
MNTNTTVSRPEHGYWLLGSTRCKILVAGEDTGGEIAVVDGRMPAGDRSPLHRHADEDESFVVLEGRARVLVGDEVRELCAGDTAMIPRGAPHAYLTLEPTRWIVVATGRARFDRFVEDLGRPVTDLAGPTEPEPALDRVAAVAALHDIEVLGPPPAVLEEAI